MSGRAEIERIRERVAGKWQIPLFMLSLALLVAALAGIERPGANIPLDTLLERIAASIDGRMYSVALADSNSLLAYLQEQERGQEIGAVYLLQARAISLRAQDSKRPDASTARQVLRTYRQAASAGQRLGWQDHRNRALAQEWLGQYDAAIASYDQAAAEAGPRRLELDKRILELKRYPLKVPEAELQPAIDEFIVEARERPDLLHWAVESKVDFLTGEGRGDEALSLLEGLRPAFESTHQRERFEYLIALTLYKSGRHDQAEAALRALRNRLLVRDDVDAMSGWLLGRVVLYDTGPQRPGEALSFFRDVISAHAEGLYVDASKLGMGEGLATLEQYDESLKWYTQVLASLHKYPDSVELNKDVVRASMTVAAQELRRRGDLETALRFLDPAVGLVDPADTERLSRYLEWQGTWRAVLAGTLRDRAQEVVGEEQSPEQGLALNRRAADLFVLSAETFTELAHVNTLSESRSADAIWRAAELFDEAGVRDRTIAVLREFVRERPSNSLVPRALLRLGQSLQALGRYDEAIEAYRENLRRFPRTPDASSALIPLARCFIALGKDHFEDAEKTLRLILDNSPIFTPQAPEFADALFLLGDLLTRRGRFEDSIPLLVEAMRRYPEDRRLLRAEFLLADAYRQSALALRDDLLDARLVGQKRRLEAEQRRRLEEAAERFGRLVRRFEDREEETLDELRSLYLRHARLYEADCWFELRQYERALKKYERAAWVYRDTPSALAAYVQIINCHVYLGQPQDARAALRRAQYLLTTIPAERFADASVTGSRQEWERYFRWQDQSELF